VSPRKQTINSFARHFARRTRQQEKESAMTRETSNYARLGVEACEAFTVVRTILSIAAPLHVLQTTTTVKPEPVKSFGPLYETKHWLNVFCPHPQTRAATPPAGTVV
jgi:hypothetical protein